MKNTKFTVAIHTLVVISSLQDDTEKHATSDMIAESVNTNPVVIRRLVAKLRKANLVTSQPGVGGGMQLVRAADQISLLDVYEALEENEEVFPLHANQPNEKCTIGGNIQPVLCSIYGGLRDRIKDELSQTTIADIQQSIMTSVLN